MAAVDEAARLFAGLGHELVAAAPPVGSEEALSPMLPLIASAAANAIDSFVGAQSSVRRTKLQPTTLSTPAPFPVRSTWPASTPATRSRAASAASCTKARRATTWFLSPERWRNRPFPIGRHAMDNADYLAYRQ